MAPSSGSGRSSAAPQRSTREPRDWTAFEDDGLPGDLSTLRWRWRVVTNAQGRRVVQVAIENWGKNSFTCRLAWKAWGVAGGTRFSPVQRTIIGPLAAGPGAWVVEWEEPLGGHPVETLCPALEVNGEPMQVRVVKPPR